MCGIFGIASTRLEDGNYTAYTNTLSHRGPDAYGDYQNDNVFLGHRRLSIIDLEGGVQPFFNESKSLAIIFNGEIYNYKEIRQSLIQKGYRFISNSDTETILVAYQEWGESCVQYFEGMFAFAIWDNVAKRLFIARDRLGIKPLLFAEYDGKLVFASEIKAIIADPKFPREIDERAVVAFFNYSYIPAPYTIFTRIRKLLPGHHMTWQDGRVTTRKYWDLNFSPDENRNEDDYVEELLSLFSDSVKGHLVSDVPVGAFLSGGVDSSAVVALMSQHSQAPVNTFCMGFGGDMGGYLDERGFAEEVASRFNTRHVTFEVVPNLDSIVDSIVDAFDEPFADDSSIPTYFICKLAAEKLKVTLSGLGGDELFSGYERYLGFHLQSYYSRLPRFLRKSIIAPLTEKIPERADGHYTMNHLKRFTRGGALTPDQTYLSYISQLGVRNGPSLLSEPERLAPYHEEILDLYSGYFKSDNVDGPASSLNRALYCDIKTYLPDDILTLTDRISMQHSLEVRVPFLDHRLVEFSARIPPAIKLKKLNKKYILKKAFKNILPDSIMNHRKQGFVGPTSKWLKSDLKPFVLDCLSEKNLLEHNYINPGSVQTLLDEHFTGKQINDKVIWSLVMFQKWFERYID